MAGADLSRLRDDLTETLGERVNALASQEETDPKALGRLLGEIRAAREVTRAIAGTEARIRQHEAQRDRLRATLNDADTDEKNRTKERMDVLQARLDQLAQRRVDLTSNLNALARTLRG